jgi:Formate hydrogenlyase subunit 3/Multisubunit Na+/H+ antiporter, MnhD subunit
VTVEFDVLAWSALAAAATLGAIGALLAVLLDDHRPSMIAVAAACVALAGMGIAVILGPPIAIRVGDVLGFRLIDLRFDALAGTFLVALGVVGAAASVYALGYHEAGRSRFDTFAYAVFLASLALVFGSTNAFSFLFAWELMAISSAILVIGPNPDRSVVRAGYVYLAMTHLATAAIAVAFAIWAAAAGSVDFAAFPGAAGSFDGPTRDIIFLLLLVGFGTKAGMMPLHIWLPRAHPVAPSHVSALMSGVMIKAGIYGLIRFGIEFLGAGPAWWGLLVLAIGAASAILGVLYALAEHDLKRLLAFHSIENIGIILIGLGVALLGTTLNANALVVIGLAAALFHTINHALFKGLLFLGAGAVQSATRTRDLNRLGGLARLMPLTALAFGIGAAAISGLPPLNGFASEWLTYQGLLSAAGTTSLDPLARFAAYGAVGALALTAALAVACFVKATGMTFLALPRTPDAARATEVGRAMRVAMTALALCCVAAGIGATPIATVLAGVARSLVRGATPVALGQTLPPPTIGTYQAALVALALAGASVAILTISRVGASPARKAPTWTCGIAPEPVFEYTATSFSKPLRLFFERVLRPDREIVVEFHAGTPFPRLVTYRSEVDHLIESRAYGPIHRASIAFSESVRRLQQGTLQLYVAYTVVAVVVLLLVTRA